MCRSLPPVCALGDAATVEPVTTQTAGAVVAELEICHSRPIAPTRRIALGSRDLPCDPAPGAGGLLLVGVLAHVAPDIEPELREDLVTVMDRLGSGRKVIQPIVRHRYQVDRIGLTTSRQRLLSGPAGLEFDFEDENVRAVQLALGAVYAAGTLPPAAKKAVFDGFQKALVWERPVDSAFVAVVMGGRSIDIGGLRAWNDPVGWALDTLGIDGQPDEVPSKRVVQRRFRSLLRDAHPDHGGHDEAAAARIAELSEARRILLASD